VRLHPRRVLQGSPEPETVLGGERGQSAPELRVREPPHPRARVQPSRGSTSRKDSPPPGVMLDAQARGATDHLAARGASRPPVWLVSSPTAPVCGAGIAALCSAERVPLGTFT